MPEHYSPNLNSRIILVSIEFSPVKYEAIHTYLVHTCLLMGKYMGRTRNVQT